MTTKEIVRALRELEADNQCSCICDECDEDDCLTPLFRSAADLIEQMVAENADLRKELERKDMVIALAQRKQAEAEAERDALREKVPQWVSVDDRRPKPGTRVLATDGVFVGEAYRTSADTWRRYDGIAMRDCIGSVVTHWMPLPEAPEEGEKDA